MKIIICAVLISVYLTGSTFGNIVEEDLACNCDHCEKTNGEILNELSTGNPPQVISLANEEQKKTDDRLVICARGRDLPDKTFPSVCHMLCQNRCSRFNVTEIIEGKIKRYITTVYRTNYYKLRDGPCKKL